MINKPQRPAVSVMMPVYNGRKYIDASVQSLINQTFADWECIIVNDGSTDGTAEYLAAITDPRFRIVTLQKNCGRATAREKALSLATGEFLAMLDAEDVYHPEKLERQVRLMRENQSVALVSCSICSFGTKCDILYKRPVKPGLYQFDRELPSHASSMLRTDRAKMFHYNPMLNYSEDVDFLRQYLTGQKFMVTADVLYYYSEIDSVTKGKLISYYKNGVAHGLSKIIPGVKLFVVNGLKYLVGSVVYPWIDIRRILLKRGVPLTEAERSEYESAVTPLINKQIINEQK